MQKNKVIIIGAGVGGLTAACYLAKKGYAVTVIEKNKWLGGRVQTYREKGYSFDMGPSFYWMPDIFDNFFSDFNKKRKDYYALKRLNPSYRIFFNDEVVDLPISQKKISRLFEKYETHAGKKIEKLQSETNKIYDICMKTFIPNSYSSVSKIVNLNMIIDSIKLLSIYNGFLPVSTYYRKYFSNEKLLKILEFPIFFLGASTNKIPSVYALMNYIDLVKGTWYPIGGFQQISKAISSVATDLGVKINLNEEVNKLYLHNSTISGVQSDKGKAYKADIVIANADYPYIQSKLLPKKSSSYSKNFWKNKRLAPSAFIIYLGLNKKIQSLTHHSLFFHNDWQQHNKDLFISPKWPNRPLYYVSCSSKTDTTAPNGHETLIILLPISPGLKDTKKIRDKYYKIVINDLENKLKENITDYIEVSKMYCINDFSKDFFAYKGNAYGLAQTTLQTAIFRPKMKDKKIKNLYYTGQWTVPGIGVPLAIISGKLVSNEIENDYRKQ